MDEAAPVLIIFGAFIFAGTMRWMKYKAEALKHSAANGDLRREMDDMRERIKVLERIVTDKRTRLEAEIDAL